MNFMMFIAVLISVCVVGCADSNNYDYVTGYDYRKTQGNAISAIEEAARKGIITPVDPSTLTQEVLVEDADTLDKADGK